MRGSLRTPASPDASLGERWGDHLISHVRYRGTEIVKVLAWEDQGQQIAGGRQLKRKQVLELLRSGHSIVTISRLEADPRKWRPEATVRLVSVGGRDYIRTDATPTPKDDLGSLAAF